METTEHVAAAPAPAPAAAVDRSAYNLNPEIISGAPEESKNVLNQFSNVLDLADAYRDMKSTLSKRAEHFQQKDWDAFFSVADSMRDMPKEASGYSYEPDVSVKTNHLASDERSLSEMQRLAHGMGLDRKQASILFDAYNSFITGMQEQMVNAGKSKSEATLGTLRSEWGDKFDKNVANINRSSKVIAEVVGVPAQDVENELTKIALEQSPVMMKFLARVGERVTDGSRPGYSAPESRASATMRYNEFKTNPDVKGILTNKMHPQHAEYKEKMNLLARQAFGEMT